MCYPYVMASKPKMSNTEWGLLLGVAITVDISLMVLEWLLLWMGVSLIIIPIIDIFFGLCLALYLQLRGQSFANWKRLLAFIASFIGEIIPILGEAPLWSLDVVYYYTLAKAEEKAEKIVSKIPGGKLATKVVQFKTQNKTQIIEDTVDTKKAA